MKNIFICLYFLFPLMASAQTDSILSGKYSWETPVKEIAPNILTSVLFEGKAEDMEYLQMSANALLPANENTNLQVPANEEYLLLIKSGRMNISIGNSAWSIGAGSIALLMPSERYALQNVSQDSCTYYVMKYRSKSPTEAREEMASVSFVIDWNKIDFKPHDRGGVRNYFERQTAMCKRFEMHVTTLKEGVKSHEPHTHRAEEIVLVIDNKTEMQIGDNLYKGGPGDLYYLGSNVSHAIRNDGKGNCVYFAFQFE